MCWKKDGTANTVKGFHNDYPDIHIPGDHTLIIKGETAGTGSLNVSSNVEDDNGSGAGIGGGSGLRCGNIEIQGGDITITDGVTLVTAKMGNDADNSIGAGYAKDYHFKASCGTVTIGGTEYWGESDTYSYVWEYKNGGDTYLTTSPLVYPAS